MIEKYFSLLNLVLFILLARNMMGSFWKKQTLSTNTASNTVISLPLKAENQKGIKLFGFMFVCSQRTEIKMQLPGMLARRVVLSFILKMGLML